MNPVRPSRWYYVYVLRSIKDRNFYTGFTNYLGERIKAHNEGLVTSTKFRRPFRLIYYEAYTSRRDATRREKYLKTGMGKRDLRNRLKEGLTG